MSQDLTYLMDEICAGVEIYYTGRLGGQYLKTAFILCDDYSELVSKLFLLRNDTSWKDTVKAKGDGERFKRYSEVMEDVLEVVDKGMPAQRERVEQLQEAMKQRRKRRNDFFHSTSLLDLNVTTRNCVEAFCDLFEYGGILFGEEWRLAVDGARNLATFEVMLRLQRLAFSDPDITPKVDEILKNWERNRKNNRKRGVHVAEFPEDLHLRLCVLCGGKDLRDKLRALMSAQMVEPVQ